MQTFPHQLVIKKGFFLKFTSNLVFWEENLLYTNSDDVVLVLDVPHTCIGTLYQTEKHCYWNQTARIPKVFA